MEKVIQVQDLSGKRWQVENFSNTVWEAAIWMHNFFQVGDFSILPHVRHAR